MSIIKKETDENSVKCVIKSSNILETIYETQKKDLTITFKNGRRYKYSGVMKEIYSGFEKAESQGKYFNEYIKPLTTTRISDVDVSELMKLING